MYYAEKLVRNWLNLRKAWLTFLMPSSRSERSRAQLPSALSYRTITRLVSVELAMDKKCAIDVLKELLLP